MGSIDKIKCICIVSNRLESATEKTDLTGNLDEVEAK